MLIAMLVRALVIKLSPLGHFISIKEIIMKNAFFVLVGIIIAGNALINVADTVLDRQAKSVPQIQLYEKINFMGGYIYTCELSGKNAGNWDPQRMCETSLAKAYHASGDDYLFMECYNPSPLMWTCPVRASALRETKRG